MYLYKIYMYTEVYPDRAETEAALSGVLCCSIFQIYGRELQTFGKESPVYHIKQSFGNFINVVCTFIRCNKKITGMKKKINWNRVKPIIQQQLEYS